MSQHNIDTHIRNRYENECVKLVIYNFEIVKDCTYIGKILTKNRTKTRDKKKKLQMRIEHIMPFCLR